MAGFIDAAEFEEVKKGGKAAIQNWIDAQLKNTSVTVVLIGTETNTREYVKYELQESLKRSNGMVGIYIHGIKDQKGHVATKGSNLFGVIGKDNNEKDVYFSVNYKTYDWKVDDGYANIGTWIEEAAKAAGK